MASLQFDKCFVCNTCFLSHKTLITHIKISHPFLSVYRCQCHRSFKDLNGLRKHLGCHNQSLQLSENSSKTNEDCLGNFTSNLLSNLSSVSNPSITLETRSDIFSERNISKSNLVSDSVSEDIKPFIIAFIGKLQYFFFEQKYSSDDYESYKSSYRFYFDNN